MEGPCGLSSEAAGRDPVRGRQLGLSVRGGGPLLVVELLLGLRGDVGVVGDFGSSDGDTVDPPGAPVTAAANELEPGTVR